MKDLRNRFTGSKGFTLIELIVVIAILAAMAALALPTMSGLIDKSKKQVAESNARTVYSAAQALAVTGESKTTLTSADLKSTLGDGITGVDYGATLSGGECIAAYWDGGAGAWSSIYYPSLSGSAAFSSSKHP